MSSIILEAKSLTKEYKQTLALDHINLQIKKGKIYGFIGQNGDQHSGDTVNDKGGQRLGWFLQLCRQLRRDGANGDAHHIVEHGHLGHLLSAHQLRQKEQHHDGQQGRQGRLPDLGQ